MSVKTVAHLNFRGDAAKALGFYQSVFGGDVEAISYREADKVTDPAEADQLMWGQVVAENGFCVMAYDVPSHMPWNPGENAYFVSARCSDSDEIARFWEKLSDGAAILQPLAPAGWSPLYGMLRDRFGIIWILDVATEYAAS